MTEAPVTVTLVFDGRLLAASMTDLMRRGGWSNSAQLAVAAVIGMLLGLGLAYQLPVPMANAGTVGGLLALVYIIARTALGRRRLMRRFAAWSEALGPTEATFSAEGIALSSRCARTSLAWPGVSDIAALPEGTAIWSGTDCLRVADGSLPEGLDGTAFRARLAAWRSA